MEKIASFRIDHLRLQRGVYVSRLDRFGGTAVTTFDIRMKRPNVEPVMDQSVMHTLEHLGATYLRSNEEWKDRIVYVGPMGCRTGLYLLVAGDWKSEDILPVLKECYAWMAGFKGEVPGAAAAECGNWRDHNPDMAAWEAGKFLKETLEVATKENLRYPE